MNQDDRDRLIRIETILTGSVVPRLDSHSEKLDKHDGRIKAVERIGLAGTIIWGGVCVGAYLTRDTAAEWIKRKVLGHP